MKIIDFNQVSKSYVGNKILDQVSLQIMESERVGLIGRNGEGKSTILKIMAQKEKVDSGEVTTKRGLRIGLLEQFQDAYHTLTVDTVLKSSFAHLYKIEEKMKQLEQEMESNVSTKILNQYGELQTAFAEQGGYEIESAISKVVNGLGIKTLQGKKYEDLSGGEQTKVALGKLLLQNHDLILLDEPTNHLDIQAVNWLTQFLKQYKGAVLIVSHDRYFLDEVVDKMIELENQELITYHTNFSGYLKEREERLLKEFQTYKDQQKKIKKMKQAIKRLREWGMQANPPNDAFFRRAKSMEKALARMEIMKRPVLSQKEMKLAFDEAKRGGEDVVILDRVSGGFSKKTLFENLDLHIRVGERIALIGENGVGKTTLIRMILGQVQPDFGEVKLGSNIKMAYLSQQMEAINENETVLSYFRQYVHVPETEARNQLASFMFYKDMVFQKIKNLSGGERMRLRLATFMNQEVNMLILDEPTNHLDIASCEVLEEAIRQFKGTILVISHDRYFINEICTRTLYLHDRKVSSYEGNYSYFAQKVII
ncbi:ribosomal protection-like ABC-F family protein [Listeria fleischmannii]|jgi:ATP-binding cassette subfamily F protein 3|uniref:ABC-F type ribosomal protection protein n=1 Tax=Listeria fleischmannii TaxID=1069827 RepID=A0A841YD68_9LIST|nr:ABC-F type ribosomal protection protein [Listeria fleischmannii]MBC1398174.1 ABC-F type ribosomal protection protein [Listeria fleischmannii]MBC1426235.1 ABC-F type ribosomal protection protein [Listeria fleischmannii]